MSMLQGGQKRNKGWTPDPSEGLALGGYGSLTLNLSITVL